MNVKQLAEQVIEATRDFVARALQPLEARLGALEGRPVPQDGKSVTLEDVRPMVEFLLEERIKALPAPKDGTSVTLADVQPMIEQHLRSLPVPQDGKSVTLDDVRPMVEEYLRSIPAPKDGESVTLEQVREMWFDIYTTHQAAWALDFERRATDVLLRAIDRIPAPKDGRDGFSLDDLQIESRDERTIVLRFVRGEVVREHVHHLSHPLDQGVFREGTDYLKGDGVTFGGSWWIAQKDAPQGKPGVSPDWRLAVKKGRDGRDAGGGGA